MNDTQIRERCLAYGYVNIPKASEVLYECEVLEKDGVNFDRLLELAAILEKREERFPPPI